VVDEIADEIVGFEASEQRLLDQKLIELDATPDKSALGLTPSSASPWQMRAPPLTAPDWRSSATSGGPPHTCCPCR